MAFAHCWPTVTSRLSWASVKQGLFGPKSWQLELACLGYSIDEKEFKTKTFGKTTREAVARFGLGCPPHS